MEIDLTNQKELKAFLERRHPEYACNLAHWNFLDSTYRGGREWFLEGNIFSYFKEGDKEYADRVERAYRFNHTREIVDLVNKHIFKGEIIRNTEDASEPVKRFWKRATRKGQPIDTLMRESSKVSSTLGMNFVVVDSTNRGGIISVADEKRLKVKTYGYIVRPQNVLDIGFDEEGELLWILIYEVVRDDKDPIKASGAERGRFRLWTRDEWFLFRLVRKGNRKIVELEGQGVTGLGVVPVIPVPHIEQDTPYTAPALIGDIAYLDRAVANYLSNLDVIIQDQTFSQLALPAQSVLPGGDGEEQILEMSTKRSFTYDASSPGHKPEFIAPDPKQAGVIISTVNKVIAEIYHSVGMAGERTKQDNAAGIDNSSGVAKAYDFERLNSLLVSKADALDTVENKIVELVERWHGIYDEKADRQDLVKYPDSYDVRSLYDEFEVAQRLTLISAPDEIRREQMRILAFKLWPRMPAALKAKIETALKDWPPDPAELMPTPSPSALLDNGESKQGQNNKDAKGDKTAAAGKAGAKKGGKAA
ncbi:hypothetical protein [Inquilinus sp. OTU3971]|uniref:hypothetical protein n=1 Tax=Inquilinus sp. OTU3971 TaxID=3043855 RepID=UPI00313F2C4B